MSAIYLQTMLERLKERRAESELEVDAIGNAASTLVHGWRNLLVAHYSKMNSELIKVGLTYTGAETPEYTSALKPAYVRVATQLHENNRVVVGPVLQYRLVPLNREVRVTSLSVVTHVPIGEPDISERLFRDLVDHAGRVLEARLPVFSNVVEDDNLSR